MKCKRCGNSSEGELCWRCKPKKGLARTSPKKEQRKETKDKYRDFLISIWDKRVHKCQSCGDSLGDEPLSFHFDHLLEKSKYGYLEYEEENIWLLCLPCHDNKSRGFPSAPIRAKIKELKEKYGT